MKGRVPVYFQHTLALAARPATRRCTYIDSVVTGHKGRSYFGVKMSEECSLPVGSISDVSDADDEVSVFILRAGEQARQGTVLT